MINLNTKFEVSMFTHYEDMKGNTKCRNWVVLGVRSHLEVTPLECRRDLWQQKTRVPGLSCGALHDPKLSRFDRIPALDRHTHTHDSIWTMCPF